MLTLYSATLPDIAKVKPILSKFKLTILCVQMDSGLAWRLDWHGRSAGLVGLVPLKFIEGTMASDELWMVLAPWLRAEKGSETARFLRELLKRFKSMELSRPCLAAIGNSHLPGQRLAALAGFENVCQITGTRAEYWIKMPQP